LRISIAKAAEPARGGHALFKGYETAIRAAADRSTAVNRAPRIVLSFGLSIEHSCCNDHAERKQDKSHLSPHTTLGGLLMGSTIKNLAWSVL
jgi:hypothetical protein